MGSWVNGYTGAGTSAIVDHVEELAKKKGVTMAQIAIAWELTRDGVTAPIVGTTNLQNLKEIIGAFLCMIFRKERSVADCWCRCG